ENEKLDQIPVSNVSAALTGKVSGVRVINNQSLPGETPAIRIQGIGSISAGNSPLIVIDGFPGGDLNKVNMNDVESIEVLKDAAASAIYGSRAAGGVIIVNTKRGSGEPTINLDAYYGFQKPYLYHDWLTGKEWYKYLVKYNN